MKNLYAKLLTIQSKGLVVPKDSVNPCYKNKYASLDKIIETYTKALSEEKLLVWHQSDLENKTLTTYIIDSESAEEVATTFPVNFTETPQKIGSQLTYAKRYNLGLLLNISTDEDDDGNKASGAIEESVKKDKKQSNTETPAKVTPDYIKNLKVARVEKMGDNFELLSKRCKLQYNVDKSSDLTETQANELRFEIQDRTKSQIADYILHLEAPSTAEDDGMDSMLGSLKS